MRVFVAVAIAICTGVYLRSRYQLDLHDPLLVLIGYYRPDILTALRWAYVTLFFTTPFFGALVFLTALGSAVSHLPSRARREGRLPDITPVEDRKELEVVIGEVHHPRRMEPSPTPKWLKIPERGLYTGIMTFGATGTGKTSCVMYPVARQVLGWKAADEKRRAAGLVMEVKGDFCRSVKKILQDVGRGSDYVAVQVNGEYRYNPLYNDSDAYASAYAIATLMNQLFGRSKEAFWQLAYTHLLQNVIMLFKTVDDYVTFADIYHAIADKQALQLKLEEAQQLFSPRSIMITQMDYLQTPADLVSHMRWENDPDYPGYLKAPWTEHAENSLRDNGVKFTVADVGTIYARDQRRRAQLAAVAEWYVGEWTQMDSKLRFSIVESITPLLAIFVSNADANYTFCPPKEAYDPVANLGGRRHGKVLPSISELIESGKVLALDFPITENPGLSRLVGGMMKLDFQRAMTTRIPRISADPDRIWRSVLFLCDEYHQFATCGESDPSGDEKFFAVSRAAKCIPVVATQSISSLKSTLGGDSWKTLVQQFQTTLFLKTKDLDTANHASAMCGREERLKVNFSLSESGANVRRSLGGGFSSDKSSLSASKSYTVQKDVVFEAKVLFELWNAQCVALVYDGIDPHPPTMAYLKPYYLDESMSYFEQLKRGLL